MNQTEDLATLIDNLYETNTEVLNDSLQQLILFCQSNNKDDIIPYFQSLFEKFPLLLLDENLSVPVQASQLLIEINNQFGQEAEPYFQGVIENLIMNLADPKVYFEIVLYQFLLACYQENGLEHHMQLHHSNQKSRLDIF